MKKSLLALAVLGTIAGTASAQTNLTIYGIVDAGIFRLDNDAPTNSKTWGLGAGAQSGNRIGFRGTEDLGGGLSAIFTLENGFNIDNGTVGQSDATSTRLFGRQAFVGLSSGSFGAIKLGRQYNPIRLAVESIDPFAIGLAGNAQQIFNTYGERSDNVINYTSPNWGGFVVQVNYGFGEVAGDNSAGRNIGASGAYNNGPIRAVLAYHKRDFGTTATPDNGDADTIFLGGSYDFGVAKAHLAFAKNKGDNAAGTTNVDSKDGLIGVSVPVGAGTILASYIKRNADSPSGADARQWAIGYTYALSKRTNFYTSYGDIKNDGPSQLTFLNGVSNAGTPAGGNPSLFNIGVRHTF